ncbi:tRNA1(Val) (adenine(37)-N6)-methyltransferase [Chitinophaga ginsengisoli]|uniref:tRNA1(Val) (adenine(37)-N6)-methyltransferase n=1 Tax=Chitinophaga ginsengisoli TaxID=363837 RepID=A0A2P8G4R3_9BACT|nr:methyltransferase [Chitinophaga ginsengisoli]PSL28926.1 tRNA1Val (adenine37-N6)-methyltransferase [Chitinophaga ginsengisoli]
MANHYFRFKQFTVHQEACAMKVCTDACLQGASTAAYLQTNKPGIQRILDIGTGTGLLSLMLAQQLSSATITAIELDAAAAGQARSNFIASPWSERLQVIETDAREMAGDVQYDFIITNPPFYESDLKSGNHLRNQAMHATTLDYNDLLTVIDRQLAEGGEFSILLPYRPFGEFVTLAGAAGFYLKEVVHVKQSERHAYFRSIGIFGREQNKPQVASMAIREADQQVYTPAFVSLLQPYYLYL